MNSKEFSALLKMRVNEIADKYGEENIQELIESMTEKQEARFTSHLMSSASDHLEADEEPADEQEIESAPLQLVRVGDETKEQVLARTSIFPEISAGYAVKAMVGNKYGGIPTDINAMVAELQVQVEKVKSGNLERSDEMLTAQAHTLDRLFNNLVTRADSNIRGGYLQAADIYLKLALKTQSQCRMTWESISSIKNPSTIRAEQLNVAQNQQVNNQQKIEKSPTKLSEVQHELCENSRTPSLEKQDDSQMEALGEINRPKVARG